VQFVEVRDGHEELPAEIDVVIVGGSIHMGHHKKELVTFATANRARLAELQSGSLQSAWARSTTTRRAEPRRPSMRGRFARRRAGPRPTRWYSQAGWRGRSTTSSRGWS
jgi:hypothetical protein